MTTAVFIQGPPRSGKDTLGQMLSVALRLQGLDARVYKFADPICDWSESFFGVSCRQDGLKDTKLEEMDFRSPREAAIAFSERAMKPLFGHDIFGRVLARKIGHQSPDVALITDSGFLQEAHPVCSSVGLDMCLAIQVRRPGKTFEGDSRSYWDMPYPGILMEVDNDGSIESLQNNIPSVVDAIHDIRN